MLKYLEKTRFLDIESVFIKHLAEFTENTEYLFSAGSVSSKEVGERKIFLQGRVANLFIKI